MIRVSLNLVKSGILNYQPNCAYVYELLPQLLSVFKTQINCLMMKRAEEKDPDMINTLIQEELTLQ